MRRFRTYAYRIVIFLAAFFPTARGEATNVVLIVADDLGWADLACYGADLHETPRLDSLAAEGVRFTQGYAAAAICSPTRASIMTGQYPARIGMTIWHEGALRGPSRERPLRAADSRANLPRSYVTLAEALQQAGYATIHVGKWHLGDAEHSPETQGFEVNIGGTHWGAPSTFFYPYAGFWSSSDVWRYVPDLPHGSDGEYLTDRLTDEAIAQIDVISDRPFFLHLAYHTVHTPIEAKASAVDYFANRIRPEMHRQNATYAAMVQSLDENVGRLLDHLSERGLHDDTLVIFTSDNGGYINEYRGQAVTSNHPLRSGKGSLYEGGVRTPWIVRLPGVAPAGATCDTLVCTTDLYPTILDVCGLDTPDGVISDGRSMKPLLTDPSSEFAERTLFFHYPHYYPTTTPVSAVRRGAWKLLHYYEDDSRELYNLESDLGEQSNLSQLHPEVADNLFDLLARWRREVGAKDPKPW